MGPALAAETLEMTQENLSTAVTAFEMYPPSDHELLWQNWLPRSMNEMSKYLGMTYKCITAPALPVAALSHHLPQKAVFLSRLQSVKIGGEPLLLQRAEVFRRHLTS
jgi:hypothetical protein